MSIVRPKGTGIEVCSTSTQDKQGGTPRSVRQQFLDVALFSACFLAGAFIATWMLGISLASLAPSVAAGLLIGWIQQWGSRRVRESGPFVSALFGAKWSTRQPLLTGIDIVSRLFVGYATGLAFAWIENEHSVVARPFGVLIYGFGAGGGSPDVGELLLLIVMLMMVAMIVGAVAMVVSDGFMRKALYEVGKVLSVAGQTATEEASGSVVEEAAIAVYRGGRPQLIGAALKGAVNGVAICLLQMAFGLK
jgi:hypothetical protein